MSKKPTQGSKELAAYIAANHSISKQSAEVIITDLFDFIRHCSMHDEAVNIKNFGKFEAKTKPERSGRNPRTGEQVLIREHKVLKFKPAKKVWDEGKE